MTRKSIINYIKKSLSSGYKPEQIRTALIQAGHSPHEIEVLLKSTAYKHKTSKLWVIAAVLIVLTLIIVILLLTLKEEKAPALQISLLSPIIKKGESLTIKTQIINPAEKTADITIDYMIFLPGGPLLTSKKKITTITDYLTNIPEQLILNTPPGRYKLLVNARIGEYFLTQEQYFDISTEAAEEQPKIISPYEQREKTTKECLQGCDDYNACTTDQCIGGECVNEAIIPCCGNKICEQGENEANCAVDCIQKQEKLKPRPKEAGNAIIECEKKAIITERDNCFEEAAREFAVNSICDKISSEQKKDSCYMSFALKNDFTICNKISNKYTRNSCLQLEKMSSY